MHHKKGWISKRKEGLFRVRFRLELGKIKKRYKTKWVPESMVHFMIQKLGEKYNADSNANL